MNLLEYIRRQFIYDIWANREVLEALSSDERLKERPQQLLAHILSAERLWLQRIQMQPQSLPVWPDFSPGQCRSQIAHLDLLWREYLGILSAEDLSEKVSYQNSKGERWSSTVQDILVHVPLHSAYHRGQIASEVRASGEQPPYTDFIHAARRGLME